MNEGTLRARLAEAVAQRVEAEAVMRAAAEAHQRGLAHAAKCQKRVAGFVVIADQIAERTLQDLRDDGRAELTAEEKAHLAERTEAEVALAAAQRAETQLLRELGIATDRHTAAERAQTAAVRLLTDTERGRLREEIARLECKIAACQQVIDRHDAAAPWSVVVERLLSDPAEASLEVEVADAPEPVPLAPFVYSSVVTVAAPVGHGDDEEITADQYFARQREQRIRERPQETDAVLEEQARLQAQLFGTASPVRYP